MTLAVQPGRTRFRYTSTTGPLGGYKDIFHRKHSYLGEAGSRPSRGRAFEAPVAWIDWEPFPIVTRHVPKAPLVRWPMPRSPGYVECDTKEQTGMCCPNPRSRNSGPTWVRHQTNLGITRSNGLVLSLRISHYSGK